MDTANIIAAVAAGETVTTKKKGTCKGQKVELTITHTAPAVRVVDETVKEEPVSYTGKLPVDAGKRTVELFPGTKLVVYSRGYVCLRVKGKDYSGRKVEVGKPLYREELKVLIEALSEELRNTVTYEEANGIPF